MVTWLLIHSPLVGAGIWTPLAAELRKRGQEVIIPDLTPALAGHSNHASRQAELVAAAAGHGPVVLVAHSGAGPLLPLISHRLARQNVAVLASLFVDAGLPHPRQSAFDVLPAPAAAQLLEMTVEGWLPPWTSWWPAEQLQAMLPDDELRNLMVEICPRLPLSLFTEVLPDVSEDELGICSYLRLGSAYGPFADQAEQAGWPLRRLESHHLAVLTSPAEVADILQEMGPPHQAPAG